MPDVATLFANAPPAAAPAPAAKSEPAPPRAPGEAPFDDLANAAANDAPPAPQRDAKSAKTKDDKVAKAEGRAKDADAQGTDDSAPAPGKAAPKAARANKSAAGDTKAGAKDSNASTDKPLDKTADKSAGSDPSATPPAVVTLVAAAPVKIVGTPSSGDNGEVVLSPPAPGTADADKAGKPIAEAAANPDKADGKAAPAKSAKGTAEGDATPQAVPAPVASPPAEAAPAEVSLPKPDAVQTEEPKPAKTPAASASGNGLAFAALAREVDAAHQESGPSDASALATALDPVAGDAPKTPNARAAEAKKNADAAPDRNGAPASGQGANPAAAAAAKSPNAPTLPQAQGPSDSQTPAPAAPVPAASDLATPPAIAGNDPSGPNAALNILPGSRHTETAAPAPTVISLKAHTQGADVQLPTAQIAVAITRQARQGTNRFEIRLDPPELGRIDVRLEVGHDGRASATLTVDRHDTLDLLSRDARTLQKTLSDAGVTADQGALRFSLRNDQQGNGRGRYEPPATPASNNAATDEPAPLPVLSQITATLGPGRLDLRV